MELDDAMDLGQLQHILDIEFELEVVADLLALVEKAWSEFHIILWKPL